MNSKQTEYITLPASQCEVGVIQETRKKHLIYLNIELTCLYIGTRSLYISRKTMRRVKQLKQNPALLHRLKSPPGGHIPQEKSPDG